MGGTLLKLINGMLGADKKEIKVTAPHITPRHEVSPNEAIVFERESFAPIKAESARLHIPIETIYKAGEDVNGEIMETYTQLKPDLVILGGARMMFTDNILGGKIRKLMHEITSDVFILSDRGLNNLETSWQGSSLQESHTCRPLQNVSKIHTTRGLKHGHSIFRT